MTWRRLAERPRVVAHRGASAELPENTIAAFRRAAEHGADAVELDVRPCASGELMVFHDDDLGRLTGQPGAIEQWSLAALRGVRVAGAHRLPTLDEVLEELAPTGLGINLELKTNRRTRASLPASLVRALRGHRARDQLLISSFDPVALALVRRRDPSLPVGLLFHGQLVRPLARGWAASVLRPLSVHPERHLVTAERMAFWRRAGWLVATWTADREAELSRLDALGVDAVITNDPARALACYGAG